MIYKSYNISGKDSARILMLSATPGLNGVMGAINMINLIISEPSKRIETESGKFIKKFIKSDMSGFTQEGKNLFSKKSEKYVSFLDTTRDYTRFAKKVFETYNDPISKDRLNLLKKIKAVKNENINNHCKFSDKMKIINNIIKMEGLTFEEKLKMLYGKKNNKKNKILSNDGIRQLRFLSNVKNLMKECKKKYDDKKQQEKCINHLKINKNKEYSNLKLEVHQYVDKCKMDFKMSKKNKLEQLKMQKNHEKNKIIVNNNQERGLEKCKNNPMSRKDRAKCIKEVMLWNDTYKKSYKFENNKFNPEHLNIALPIISMKFKKLLNKIKELDKKDKCIHKKTFKHIIYVDEQKYVKILMSVLLAQKKPDFKLVYKLKDKKRMRKGKLTTYKSMDLEFPERKRNNNYNFAALTNAGIYNRHIGKNLRNKIKDSFNERNELSKKYGKNDNVYGQKNFRFLIMDKNFLEGVSFFDVKYLHILTEPKTDFQKQQLVGRVVRRCGHKGLPINKEDGGWKVNILSYNNRDKTKQDLDKYQKWLETPLDDAKDDDKINLIQNIIVGEMQNNAFDRPITEKIGVEFKKLFDDMTDSIQ